MTVRRHYVPSAATMTGAYVPIEEPDGPELAQLRAERDRSETEHAKSYVVIDQLRAELEIARNNTAQCASTTAAIVADLNSARAELESTRAEFDQRREAAVGTVLELKAELAEVRRYRDTFLVELANTRANRDMWKDTAAVMREQQDLGKGDPLVDPDARVAEVEQELESTRKERDECAATLVDLMQSRTAAREERDELRRALRMLWSDGPNEDIARLLGEGPKP